ncbi:hypothetical protein AB0J83_35255 [Actinoplanes sp. NPDC049596]|uniref:hypothetical protein n=1 Tax=unclassified Actinoplanes TaxID=2626549 RepID=UPI003427AC5B
MSGEKSLEERVTAVEAQVEEVHTLAAGADRDVADLRVKLNAHVKLLEAMRKTQVDHYKECADHRKEFNSFRAENRAGLAHITRLLEGLAKEPRSEGPSQAN